MYKRTLKRKISKYHLDTAANRSHCKPMKTKFYSCDEKKINFIEKWIVIYWKRKIDTQETFSFSSEKYNGEKIKNNKFWQLSSKQIFVFEKKKKFLDKKTQKTRKCQEYFHSRLFCHYVDIWKMSIFPFWNVNENKNTQKNWWKMKTFRMLGRIKFEQVK